MLFLGIDAGTSSIRCIVINENGVQLAGSKCALPAPDSPAPGWYQQDPQLWGTSLAEALTDLGSKIDLQQIAGICVDATSATVLLADADNRPLTAALMYNDNRAADVVSIIKQAAPPGHLTINASSSLAKVLWLAQQMPSTQVVSHITHQADWINTWLTGISGCSDVNNVLKLGYDSANMCWPGWIKQFNHGLFSWLPEVEFTGKKLACISAETAKRFGFNPQTPVFLGTTDSTASTLASGISSPGDAVTTLGSTMVMKVITAKPVESLKDGIYSHRLPSGLWLAGGASNSGGNVLLKYFTEKQIAGLSSQIDITQPTGLDYYPLAQPGERFPINDPQLSPVLAPRPESDSRFLQAIFEGFARIEKLAYEKIAELGGEFPRKIVTAGGAAADNPVLTALRRQILDVEIATATHTEAGYGAAMLARDGFRQMNQ